MKVNSKTTSSNKNKESFASTLEQVKVDLLSLVSHELRTPLTSVLNALKMLKEEPSLTKVEQSKLVDMAYRNADALNSRLLEMLDLSKLVTGRLVCRLQEVNLKHLTLAVLDRFSEKIENKGLKVKVIGRTELPVILGDAVRLEQVLKSLLENASEFSPTGTSVEVELKTKPNVQVQISISNVLKEGTQLPQNLEEIFTVFGQQESILDRTHEGVGGSLALGQEILEQHGGSLKAEVKKQKFSVHLVIPLLTSEDALLKVLESRIYALKNEVGALSLLILEVQPKAFKTVQEALVRALFRASDSVFTIPEENQLAVVMDDCKKTDAPKIVKRLLSQAETEVKGFLKTARVGLASCPDDTTDPKELIKEARASFISAQEL